MLTGRYGGRTGIGRWIAPSAQEWDLKLSELTIPEMLGYSSHNYTSAAVGKWHLGSFWRENPGTHPLQQGFLHHFGSMANPKDAISSGNFPRGYYNWEKNSDGAQAWSSTYMTTDTTDMAIDMASSLPEPWFLWVAYNGAHTPLELPPSELHNIELSLVPSEEQIYDAMVQATDSEIGRLLGQISDEMLAHTTIIYVSDNGTPSHGMRPPSNGARSKGSVYEGGVNVPFIVSSSLLSEPTTETDALVHFVDVFPTVAELAGVDLSAIEISYDGGGALEIDGQSFLDVLSDQDAEPRAVVYTEGFKPNGRGNREWYRRMVRDDNWKLVRNTTGTETDEYFFALESSLSTEGNDLIVEGLNAEQQLAYDRLTLELDAIETDLVVQH